MSKLIPIELTLYTDMVPRTRPHLMILNDGEPGEETTAKLYPGAGARSNEVIVARMWFVGYHSPLWILVRVHFILDGLNFSDPRPGLIFIRPTDIPSEIVTFPSLAPQGHPLGGTHTIHLRCISTSKKGGVN